MKKEDLEEAIANGIEGGVMNIARDVVIALGITLVLILLFLIVKETIPQEPKNLVAPYQQPQPIRVEIVNTPTPTNDINMVFRQVDSFFTCSDGSKATRVVCECAKNTSTPCMINCFDCGKDEERQQLNRPTEIPITSLTSENYSGKIEYTTVIVNLNDMPPIPTIVDLAQLKNYYKNYCNNTVTYSVTVGGKNSS
jgi:hypothetical protein